MATIVLTGQASVFADAVEAVTIRHGYKATIPDGLEPPGTIPNPQTPAEFTRQHVIKYLKNEVKQHKAGIAAAAAAATAEATVESNFIVT